MTDSPSSCFEYQPLDPQKQEIRVLELQSRYHDIDPPLLSYSLTHVSLAQNPMYDALSYVWGDPTQKETIVLNGELFGVARNLFAALQELAVQRHDRIWVDAICMNQADISEKNSQLPLMRHIYSRCRQVIIWLGTTAHDSDLAFDHLRLVSELDATVHARGGSWGDSLSKLQTLEHEDASRKSQIISSIVSLYARPYWRRTWIIQEISLAFNAIVMCGSKSMSWTTFCSATYRLPGERRINAVSETEFTGAHAVIRIGCIRGLLGRQGNYFIKSDKSKASVIFSTDGEPTIYLRDDYLPEGEQPLSLLDVLMLCSNTQATNQLDHLYGLLGLADDASHMVPCPDYRKSVSEVFTGFAWEVIRKTRHINIICLGQSRICRSEDLPSWVLDASSPLGLSMTLHHWDDSAGEDVYRACGSYREFVPEQALAGSALKVKGLQIDSVDGLGSAIDATGAVTRPIVQADHQQNPYGSPKVVIDTMWRCFILGVRAFDVPEFFFTSAPPVIFEAARRQEMDPTLDPELTSWCNSTSGLLVFGKPLSQWVDQDEWFSHLSYDPRQHNLQYPRLPLGPRPSRGLQNFNSTSKNFAASFRKTTIQKRMLITSQGYLGMAPLSAEKGDIIVIIQGCKVPVVLRPRPGGEDYQVVGEAYVKGFMKGEGVEGMKESDFKELVLS